MGYLGRQMEILKSQKKFNNWKLQYHSIWNKKWLARLLDTEKENFSELEDRSMWII